jgi:hypothetical protein
MIGWLFVGGHKTDNNPLDLALLGRIPSPRVEFGVINKTNPSGDKRRAMASEPRDPDLPGILRRTPAIRRRIYLYVDHRLSRWAEYHRTLHGVYNLGDQYEPKAPIRRFDRAPPAPRRDFHGLLLSCRTIYTEASASLYSSHWYLVRYHAAQSLAPLRALSPTSIASLTNLRVILNECSCHGLGDSEGYDQCCVSKSKYEPILP